jgi:hypothetical protein
MPGKLIARRATRATQLFGRGQFDIQQTVVRYLAAITASGGARFGGVNHFVEFRGHCSSPFKIQSIH